MTDRVLPYQLTIPIFFDAAHRLNDSQDLFTKKCAQLHGHTYHTLITVQAANNNQHGMIIDFKRIKDAVNDRLDHKYVNDTFADVYGVNAKEATAENIGLFIKELVAELLVSNGLKENNVIVKIAEGYKGPDSSAYVIV